MKKVLLGLVLLVCVFAMSSCSKKCDCKAKLNGETIWESTVELGDGEKCSDKNGKISVAGISAESKCTPVLF